MESFLEEFQYLKIELEEIKLATDNFDKRNIIGKGGFGVVYEGVLSHSRGQSKVAFKRLDRNYGQGDPEFWKEILMLSRYTHENLISLLGFCDEDGEKILVYEHASHGSLDRLLNSATLTWTQRLKICLGAAKGLCYLHDPKETQQRVLHRDIKSSNFLLDENWNAKVSDMGLSKIGPANQQYTFLVSNVVGTFGYVDPMYVEMSILTKESDIYSFGVVLFEVLCGKLCFEKVNGHLQSLVRMWKQCYKRKTLHEIIFQDLKQHMDPSSLETFSNIAYQCLHKSLEERPKMYQVVEKLEIALRFQETSEEVEQPVDYEELSKSALPPLVYTSKEELRMLLSNGIFVNEGKTWFSLNKNGKHCELILAAECLIPVLPEPSGYGRKKSRFAVDYYIPLCFKFKTNVRTQFLTPNITYAVNLVFSPHRMSGEYLGLDYILAGETKSSSSYFVDKREDGLLMAELYQFTSDKRNVDFAIAFQSRNPIAVEGIEFQPLERVEQEVLEEEQLDLQTILHSDSTYWEKKLPSDYEDIIKLSLHRVKWTTKKELYSILRKGFPINNGEEWFSIAKNGEKCHMLLAKATLQKSEWSWRSSPESRFGEVAFNPHGSFWIYCRPKMLSPQTTYATYLVYKLEEDHCRFEPPLKVSDCVFYRGRYETNHSWYIFLLSPQTPTIRLKAYDNTHKSVIRTNMKGFSQQREDGWMEVQVWEFQTGTTIESISKHLLVTYSTNKTLKGLIVKGFEFKPI